MLSVLLIILFSILDFGLISIRQTALSEGARRVARAAAVRGERADGHLGIWGPTTVDANATALGGAADILRPVLIAMEPAEVSIRLEWPDGDTGTNDRIQVTVSYPHESMMPLVLGNSPIVLIARSTVRIHH